MHRGEVEVIIGAKELGILTVVIDDRSVRNLAEALLFNTNGVIGVLWLTKIAGYYGKLAAEIQKIDGNRRSEKKSRLEQQIFFDKNVEG
ncbi:MAG: hypothetical protein P4L59_10645 [Desulfosporosinus sp.]|nr:hypothetical protein [Desulfosporosinus sp.]